MNGMEVRMGSTAEDPSSHTNDELFDQSNVLSTTMRNAVEIKAVSVSWSKVSNSADQKARD